MKKSLILAMLVLPFSISAAYAGEGTPLTVSGFGSAGYTTTNTNDAEFVRYNGVEGATTSGKTTGVDSLLGLQATKQVNNWLSFTGQGLVRKDASPKFGAELSWAFAKAKISPDVSIRVGRIGAPVYMISDYINVGYANTMLRSPVEMYSQVAFDKLDGADVVWTKSLGDTTVTSQLAYGKSERKLAIGGKTTVDDLAVFNIAAEHGPVALRFSRAQGKVSLVGNATSDGLLGALSRSGFAGLANEMRIDESPSSFTSFGLTSDHKNVVVQSEFAKRKSDSYIADTTSWYVMGGYRIGKFLPYVTHSSLKQDSPRTSSVVPMAGPFIPLAMGVNSALAQEEQVTNSIGVRWDFNKSAALKLQADRITPKGEGGLFVNQKPGFNGPVSVFAAAVDFTF